jgi:uncharacterized protein DUF4272
VILRRKRERVLPDQRAVIDRVLCTSVVAMLGAICDAVREETMDGEDAAKYLAESHRWLRREHLADALSIGERALISKAMADWSEREAIDAGWRSEAAGVLLWALSAYNELPPYDTRFETLPALVPLLAPTSAFRDAARLRSPGAIAEAREAAQMWHSRSRVAPIAGQRHYALNWLCGYGANWDSVPTDT